MKFFHSLAAVLVLAGAATAQEPAAPAAATNQVAASPSDSSYFMDRETAVRMARQQRAAWKSAQRIQRLEMYKWYGYSPLRPPAATYSMMGSNLGWYGPIVYHPYAGTLHPRAGFGH